MGRDPESALDIIPHVPVASSRARGWHGVALHVFREQDGALIHADGFSHHFLILRTEHAVRVRQRRDGREVNGLSVPGQLELTPAGMPGEWEWHQPLGAIHLHIDPALLLRFAAESGRDPAALCLRAAFSFTDPLLKTLVESLQSEVETGLGGPIYAETLATAIAAHLATRHAERRLGRRTAPGGLSARQLRLVQDFVEERLGTALTLDALAQVAGVSRFHFARLFKATTGESPHKAVTRRRAERARRLIVAGHPVAETAIAVGFSDQSHLCRHYKRLFGETPARTRKNLL
jgi:AraC family transcriptional regulator